MKTPRILIVEDEPKLGQLLIDYLQAAGYAPALINHGDKVLPYVRQTPPHLILLDLMPPGTDGLTLCREIRRRFCDVPVVMVTAKIEEIPFAGAGNMPPTTISASPTAPGSGRPVKPSSAAASRSAICRRWTPRAR